MKKLMKVLALLMVVAVVPLSAQYYETPDPDEYDGNPWDDGACWNWNSPGYTESNVCARSQNLCIDDCLRYEQFCVDGCKYENPAADCGYCRQSYNSCTVGC